MGERPAARVAEAPLGSRTLRLHAGQMTQGELAEVEPAFVRRGTYQDFCTQQGIELSPVRWLEPFGPVELKGVARPLEVRRAGGGPAGRSRPGARRW